MTQVSSVRRFGAIHSLASALAVGAVVLTAAWGRAESAAGVWTLRKTSPGGSPWESAANWQNGYVPTNAHDSATLAAVYNDTHDRTADWTSASLVR